MIFFHQLTPDKTFNHPKGLFAISKSIVKSRYGCPPTIVVLKFLINPSKFSDSSVVVIGTGKFPNCKGAASKVVLREVIPEPEEPPPRTLYEKGINGASSVAVFASTFA